jgi:hypothetical protein
MKLGLLLILFLILISCLTAITYSTDDSIDLVLLSWRLEEIGGIPFYVPLIYDDPVTTSSEETALDCIADTGLTFAIVQDNLTAYTSTPDTDNMKLVKGLAFPFIRDGKEYMAVIKISLIADGFNRSTFASLNEDQRYERSRSIVEAQAIREPMFDEEE